MFDGLYETIQSLPEENRIYLYGCGKYGLAVYELLKQKHIEHRVAAFLVTNTSEVENNCYGKDILSIDSIKDNDKNAVIFLTLNEEYQAAIIPILQKKELFYYTFNDNKLKTISNEVNRITDDFFNEFGVSFSNEKGRDSILVIKLDGIGDVVLCTPFLKLLRKHFPDSEISMIVSPSVYKLMNDCPYIDCLYVFDSSDYVKYPLHEKADRIKRYVESLGRLYELAIIPRMDVDYYGASLIAYFSGASERVTYSECATKQKEMENQGYDRLFSKVIVPDGVRHESLRNISILEALGVRLTEDEKKTHCEVWENDSSNKAICAMVPFVNRSGKHVVFGMSAADKKREWPWNNFLRLAYMILSEYPNVDVILCGKLSNNDEIEQCINDNGTNTRIFNMINRTSIPDIVSIMKKTDVYIGNDTGMMHIAAACDNRIIELSCHPKVGDANSENSPKRFGAWMTENIILSPIEGLDGCNEKCIEKHAHCIKQITVEDVYDAFKKFWKG
ncbi:glycosyltransferase family 9 protein [Lachnospiraceae bacterium C1.1]|nr:glycosyltransferase family 9 protein [Lachnospiraceae bacterium C1.1]